MPIKFKCGCGHVLTVQDKFAGKAGKCPKCQNTVKVPSLPIGKAVPNPANSAGKPMAKQSAPAPKSAAAAAAAPTTLPTSPGGLDALFDDVGLKRKTGPICPKCAADIKRGTVICTKCGFNFESGEQVIGFDVASTRPEFENAYLQEASKNMVRDLEMDKRRDRAAMPWWVLMSFLIGAITLCAAGVIIVDGRIGTPAPEGTFIGNVQRLPVFTVLGLTACITGLAITSFAHLSICFFGFTKSVWQGLACFFLPLIYSIVYGILNWSVNKAPVKAIITALMFIGFGIFLIVQGGGFKPIIDLF